MAGRGLRELDRVDVATDALLLLPRITQRWLGYYDLTIRSKISRFLQARAHEGRESCRSYRRLYLYDIKSARVDPSAPLIPSDG